MSNTSEAELKKLQNKLNEAEESLQRAAQYGLQLLDEKLDLQNLLEEQQVDLTNALEILEQEKYTRQREVELKERMIESLRSEFEAVKSQQNLLLEKQEAQLKKAHSLELSDFKTRCERLKTELSEVQLNEKQLKHKLEVHSEILKNKEEEIRALADHAQDSMSSDVLELQVEKAELQSAKADLERDLQEALYKEQQLQLTNTNLHHQLDQLTQEKEECEMEAVSCFNALEKARETNQDLQIQLNQLLQQAQDPSSKGNSLFAEVEDKRAEMERQLISMKVQHLSLLKQHTLSRQQLQRMKVQVANLMQLQGSTADPVQMERLRSMLSEKNDEIEALMKKLRQVEKLEAQPLSLPAEDADSTDNVYYAEMLKMQLSNLQKDAEQLRDEVSRQRMKAFSESQRVLELERKLFSTERTLKLCQSNNIMLEVKVDELRLKYEPNEVNKNLTKKRKRERLPVDVPGDGQALVKEEPESVTEPPEVLNKQDTVTVGQPHFVKVASPLLQPAMTPKPAHSTHRHSKCVRDCEELSTTSVFPRSPPMDCKVKEEELTMGDKNKKERKNVKSHGVHAGSQPTLEQQCTQQ